MSQSIYLISPVTNDHLDIEALCADFGDALPPFVAELQRGLAISSQFADLYERHSLNSDQINAMALWAASVTPALESLSITLARNNERLAAAF